MVILWQRGGEEHTFFTLYGLILHVVSTTFNEGIIRRLVTTAKAWRDVQFAIASLTVLK